MGEILGRNRAILGRANDLAPAGERIAEALRRGKREQLLASRDAEGNTFPPLAASTLRRGGRDPRPLLPHGEGSDLAVNYVVSIAAHPGGLVISAGWPGNRAIPYLRSGTRRMPRRDPTGFPAEALDEIRRIAREYLTDGR